MLDDNRLVRLNRGYYSSHPKPKVDIILVRERPTRPGEIVYMNEVLLPWMARFMRVEEVPAGILSIAIEASTMGLVSRRLIGEDLLEKWLAAGRLPREVWLDAMAVNPDSEVGRTTNQTYILTMCSDRTVVEGEPIEETV
jgi:hypothetical protein